MICRQCGQEHSIDEMELTFRRPDAVATMDADERERTVREDDDLCAIDARRFFVRAVLPLPVASRETPYRIGLWVEVDRAAFGRIIDLWSDPSQANEAPFPARIANDVPTLPSTIGLSAELQLTGPRTRPYVTLGPMSHPLAEEQVAGISLHRAHEYSSQFG